MFKKISLLCLLSAPLFCQDASKNPIKPDSTLALSSIEKELKALRTAQEQATQAIKSLEKKLPLFSRTKMFVAGAFVGSAALLYLHHQYPNTFKCPREKISRIGEIFDSTQSRRAPSETKTVDTTVISTEDELENPEEQAEEAAARASNSCYFK